METPERREDTILVSIHRSAAFVCVKGRGTYKIGPALKQFGQGAIEKGVNHFVFDMDQCESMDSTFMGVLAGLALRVQSRDGGKLTLINLTPKAAALLRTLGLDQLLTACPPGGEAECLRQELSDVIQFSKLDASESDNKMTLETMLSAHESLVDVSEENRPKFTEVITYLKQEQKKMSE